MVKQELKIISNDGRFEGSTIELNGNPFPVTSLQLKGELNGVWECSATFYAKVIKDINMEEPKPFITNCMIEPRSAENLFKYSNGNIIPQLDGYAIIPVERYMELLNK